MHRLHNGILINHIVIYLLFILLAFIQSLHRSSFYVAFSRCTIVGPITNKIGLRVFSQYFYIGAAGYPACSRTSQIRIVICICCVSCCSFPYTVGGLLLLFILSLHRLHNGIPINHIIIYLLFILLVFIQPLHGSSFYVAFSLRTVVGPVTNKIRLRVFSQYFYIGAAGYPSCSRTSQIRIVVCICCVSCCSFPYTVGGLLLLFILSLHRLHNGIPINHIIIYLLFILLVFIQPLHGSSFYVAFSLRTVVGPVTNKIRLRVFSQYFYIGAAGYPSCSRTSQIRIVVCICCVSCCSFPYTVGGLLLLFILSLHRLHNRISVNRIVIYLLFSGLPCIPAIPIRSPSHFIATTVQLINKLPALARIRYD